MRQFPCTRIVAVALFVTALLSLTLPAAAADAVWIRQFGTRGLDEAKAVAVDDAGDTYVVGETFGTLPGQTQAGTLDAFVRKYDPAGREIWTRQFGTWERDIAWAIAIDPPGYAYVVGQTEGALPGQHSAGGYDAFVRKYDLSGTEVWTRQFGGGGADIASGVALDAAGNVYVVGTTSSTLPGQVQAGSYDAFVRRYDAAGQVAWTRQFGGPGGDNARDVDVDPTGRLLVVGSTESALPGQVSVGGYDAFVSTIDAAGNEVWTRQFGSQADDFGVAIAADPRGQISVVGSTENANSGQTSAGGTDAFLRRFDVAGAALWTDQFGTGVADEAWDVTVDADGNAYVAGTTERVFPGQQAAGRTDAFVRKYDGAGNEAWTHQFGTPEYDYAFAVALGRDGGVSIAGSTQGVLEDHSAGNLDAYVMRLVW